MHTPIGFIIGGSLAEGLTMRIQHGTVLETIKTGKFVCISGVHHRFFSMITDLMLASINHELLLLHTEQLHPTIAHMVHTRDLYSTITLRPMLMLGIDNKPMPVKTIPPHFAPVYEATHDDIALIFGHENDQEQRYFGIGTPLDMHTPVCIHLEKLTERSNGIFGKTGTGKTFLTRLVLAGLIKQKKAVNLIFDMHSEYGLQARTEGKKQFVKGLKTLFGSQVIIASLDPQSTRRRGCNPDLEIRLSYQSVQVEDILSLSYELNLHATALEAAHLIAARHKKQWLSALLQHGETIKEFADSLGAHPESIAALYRKLKRIEHLPFMTQEDDQSACIIKLLMLYIQRGISVIIEFGNFTDPFVYLLIANIITRRIHTLYIEQTEKFLGSQKLEDEPLKLMITIEEAHKFLNPLAARQTIFGIIAREMRKYYVSLLIVDQRPSGIDPEVLSQIGTKVVAQLNDEKDIQAVLTGVSGATQLRTVLTGLDSKKQALILGHAVPMPIVVQTREYDATFYAAMQTQEPPSHTVEKLVQELF